MTDKPITPSSSRAVAAKTQFKRLMFHSVSVGIGIRAIREKAWRAPDAGPARRGVKLYENRRGGTSGRACSRRLARQSRVARASFPSPRARTVRGERVGVTDPVGANLVFALRLGLKGRTYGT